ncbi:MAG: hypothetical protein O7G88_20630 [bacterium]|nr:hypothetical protein [bacterium]
MIDGLQSMKVIQTATAAPPGKAMVNRDMDEESRQISLEFSLKKR